MCIRDRYAGVGVAMQNAEEPVKAVADYVTAADNEDVYKRQLQGC